MRVVNGKSETYRLCTYGFDDGVYYISTMPIELPGGLVANFTFNSNFQVKTCNTDYCNNVDIYSNNIKNNTNYVKSAMLLIMSSLIFQLFH
jgi:hypothetical protein